MSTEHNLEEILRRLQELAERLARIAKDVEDLRRKAETPPKPAPGNEAKPPPAD